MNSLPQKNGYHGIYSRSGCGGLELRSGRALVALLIGILVLSVLGSLNAQTSHSSIGFWTLDNNGSWSQTSNWGSIDPGTDYPSGPGAFANFSTINIGGNRTITLDVPVTLGDMNIGDSSGNNTYTIQGGTLTFDSFGGVSTILKTDGGGNDTISSAIVLNNELDISIIDISNNQGLTLSGAISGGTTDGDTIVFDDLSTGNQSVNWLILNHASTFTGRLVANSGLIRLETSSSSAGATGVGNETVARNGGSIDLRGLGFNLLADDTEMFLISGSGTNGLGALRNTSGTSTISYLTLEADATIGGYSTATMFRHLNAAADAEIAPVLDLGGFALTKLGSNEWRFQNADIQGRTGATINIYEGKLKFENAGALLGGAQIDGTTYGNKLDGLIINLAYNKTPYDGVDPTLGSRTSDPYNVNDTASVTGGNSEADARLSFTTSWSGVNTLPLNVKVTDNFDNFTVNMNNGVWMREGSTGAGQTFDQIFGTGVVINLVGGGIAPDANGNGNMFDLNGGSSGFNTATGTFDNPGTTEIQGTIDNTSSGNYGTGFTVRGSRELRFTGDNSAFTGDILVKLPTYRYVSNTFDTRSGGQASSVFFNMSLAGANGSFNQAESITITRWGSLALLNNSDNPLYASANNDDRLNDAGFTNLRNGYLLLETDTSVTNHENFGHVVADYGTNVLVLDTRAGGRFDGSFQTFTRNNNGVLKIYDANPSHTWGTGGSDDRIAVKSTTGILTVGADAAGTSSQKIVIGLFGGVVPTLQTPTIGSYTRPLETVQGTYMYSGAGMGLMTLDGGYLRPLTAAEYDTGVNPTTGTNWLVNRYIAPTGAENYADRNNYAARNVTSDTAVNSLTISFDAAASSQVVGTSTKDSIIIEQGKTLTINSGVINFASYAEANSANLESVIRGGFLNMNDGVALINSNNIWQDLDADKQNWYEFMLGNSAFIRSHIIHTTDLVKTGRDTLYLDTWNTITGNIYVSDQGSLDVRNSGALGVGAPGREVQLGGSAALLLEYGTNISDINLRVMNTFQGSTTVLRAEGAAHSTWGGDVILDVADATGSSDGQYYTITARNNGTLSVYGNIYTDHNASFTDSDIYADPPVVTTNYNNEAYTLNLYGQYRDISTGNLGTDPANAAITSIYRTGDSDTRLDANHSLRFQMTGNDEGNVNVFQQWDATGRIDLRQGYFRVMYDPTTASGSGGFYTDGARALITANEYFTRFVLGQDGSSSTNAYNSHLMLTRADQVFNAPYLYIYNDNRNGTLTIGGENTSGSVYYGSTDNSVNFSLEYVNQATERDVRFLQVRGGTLVWNGRLADENSTVQSFNSSVSIVGPGTVIFNRNAIGNSSIDRWNFMAGEAHWSSMTGNDQFASNSTQALVGQSTWGGGRLVLDDPGTARSQQLNSHIWLLNGASSINTQNNTTLILGNSAANLTRRSGSSLAFLEDGSGAIKISATGLSTTDGAFLGSWAVYGSSAGVTDWAARSGSADVQAFTGYTDDTLGVGVHTNLTGDLTLGASANTATVRFATGANFDLGGGALTVDEGGILISSTVTGAVNISNGTLTSGWSSGSGDLMLYNDGTGTTTISAVITDNAGKVNLVNVGSGTTVLQGTNTYTGNTYLNSGLLQISSDSQLGAIDGSIDRLARVYNGSNGGASQTDSNLYFFGGGSGSGAAGLFSTNSGQNVTTTTLTNGGSGYTSGVYVNTLSDATGTAGIWAMLDSGSLHFDGGTLAVTNDITLDGARTLYLGGNGGTLDVAAGSNLTINGYITSEFNQVTLANGYNYSDQIGGSDQPASDRNPDIGDLIIQGGGTVLIMGAPDNNIRSFMYNSYGGITWINEGTIKIAGAGSSAAGALGTNRSASDGTIIGANGTLEFATTSDPSIYEWLTFRGRGYQGRGTIITTGTARTVRLNGQMTVDATMLVNNTNSSSIRIGEQGGALYGAGDISRIGNGEFLFYVNTPDWTGSLLNGSGNTRMYGSGSLQGMTFMSLDRNTYFGYGAGSTTTDEFRDRLNDNLNVSINGYSKMRMEAGAGVFSGIEKLGTVTVNSGIFNIEYDLGAVNVNGAPQLQGDYAGWHFTDIVRNPGTIVIVRNLDPGTDISTGVTDLSNRALALVDNAPTLSGTGDGTNGNTAIIAGFFGGTRPLTFINSTTTNMWDEDRISRFLMTSVAGIDPITGAAVNYLRPLSDAPGSTDYKIINDAGTTTATAGPLDLTTTGINADQNVRFVGITDDSIGHGFTSRINSILTLDSLVEANSVTFASDSTGTDATGAGNQVNLLMTQGGTLKINSGVLMFANIGTMDRLGKGSDPNINLDINNYIIGGNLDFNGKEAIIYAGSEWAQYNTSDQPNAYRNVDGDGTSAIIRTSIYNTGGNGLTKTGASSVTLEAANYYTGDTTVNYGYLYARHDQALGQSTRMNVTGYGGFILGYNSRIMGVDLYVGPIGGNNYTLYSEGDGNEWGGNVIIDNVDSAGSAGGYTRNFVPRIFAASSNTVLHIDGNVYGGDTAVSPGAQATARIFSTATAASLTTLDFMGQIRDKSTGAIDLGAGDTLNDVLRMEVAASSDTANVHLYQQYDSAGRITIVRGVLRYMGNGNFYTDAAALAQNPDNDFSGLQMGGRSVVTTDGTGSSDVGFFLHNAGATFNLASWNVGVDISDPNNNLGNGNYGLGNTTGNTSLGGENISGTITFGTGTGSIRFTQADTLYNRNLNLYAARGGTVDMRVNFLDGGNFVNSSITKVGAGTVRLLGSSAGDSTVEALKMLGGTLVLTGYDVNASRRVGNGAALTLSGGYLIVDATVGSAQEDFSDLTLNSGGSRLAVRGNATVNINSSITLNPASGVTMAFIENSGGTINISAPSLTTTNGERFGYWAVYGTALGQVTDWAAREGNSGVKAFTAYDVDAFASGKNTEVTTSASLAGPTITNSIKFAAAADLDLGGNTLTVENGGMLVSYAAGGAVNITNGTLTRSGAGDILLHNYGTDITTISANITNSGAGVVNLVTGGIGTTVLTGNNTYTGDTYINGGTLQISSDSQLGNINGSIARLVREYNGNNNGASLTNSALYFLGGGGSGAAGVFTTNGNQNVTATALNSGGSGYTSGVYVNTNSGGTGNAGIWAILDSGNLHIDGGTLATTDDITLDGARTIFIGASGATFDVAAGKSLTINGYITSDVTDLIPGDDNPIDLTRPLVGGLAIEGGGTLVLTGAPDNTSRNYMYNGYNSLTSINNGTIEIAGLASFSSNALGTYSGWVDSTYIGPNGSLVVNVTNADSSIYDWLTLDGLGYQGGGTFQAFNGTGNVRSIYLRGQINVLSDAVFNLRNGSNIYLNNGGGETFGSADITKIGNGEFRFYSNESNFTGNYIAASGYTRVYDAGRIMGMASMTLERNSFLGMNDDNTTSDETRSRLGDDMPIYTNGYIRMRVEGPAGVFSGIEKLGTANVMSGQLGIEFDMGGTLSGGVPVLTGEYVGFHYTEIVRNLGTSVQLRLLDSGESFADKNFNPALPSNANGNIAAVQVDYLPMLFGDGDGSNGDAPIAPGFYGGVRPNWFAVTGTVPNLYNEDYVAGRLVTVDTNSAGDHFLRPLLDSEYKVVGSPDTAQTTSIRLEDQDINANQNLKIVGVTSDSLGVNEFTSRQNSLLTLGSMAGDCPLPSGINLTVNSLTFASESYGAGVSNAGNWTSLILASNATLKINSGVIQMYNTGVQNMHGAAYNSGTNMDIRSSLNGGSTDFNGLEANFYIGSIWAHYNTATALNGYEATDFDNNYFYMNSSIVNAIGLTKTGGSSLFLDAVNYYTGLTSVNQGAIYARHDNALGYSTQVNVTGAGTFVIGLGARITGADLYVGAIYGNNTVLQIENSSVWAGDVIIDNVDSGGATAYGRNFVPRIFSNTSNLNSIEGNIYGGSTAIGSGARTDSRIFSTYTSAFGLLYLSGVVQDNAAGAVTGPIDIYSQSQVLRMEVSAYNNDESAVQIAQQYNAAGRINIDRGTLYFSGNSDFYTAAAAATVNSAPLNPMIGLQMGGRSLTSDSGRGAANLGFFLLNAGANFNLKSWQVGVDTSDPDNLAGNYVYGEGNTTGNSTLGGVNTTGTVSFGTGDGSIIFTQATTAYFRDLGLFAATGGTVDLKVNLLDGGSLVTSSITKMGGGLVNLLGSSAGDSTVEGVNVMGGILSLAGYDTNLSRRVGNGALLTLAGGTLAMDGSGASFTENFGSLSLLQGGNGIAAIGNGAGSFGTLSIAGTSINRAAAATIHFQSIAGGIINFSNGAMKNVDRIGSYATYGANASSTDWAATDAAGNVIAYTGYSTDSFGAGYQTDVLSADLAAAATNSIRFNIAGGSIGSGNLVLNDGGLLITSNYTTGTPIAAGVGVTTSGGVDLLIHNYASGVVNFDGSITGAQNVVFTGTGELAFNVASTTDTLVLAGSTITSNSYTATVSSTVGLAAGMDVTGANIAPGTRIISITNGTTLVLSKAATVSSTVDLTFSTTSYTPTNTYTGATHVTGSAVVSFNSTAAFGSTSGFFLNGGTLQYTAVGATSTAVTQTITFGGNNGIFSVADAASTLVFRGLMTSEAANVIAAYGNNNPNAGGLQIVGAGTFQFGDRSLGVEDLAGLNNTYTGLTILGDGINALTVAITGQPRRDANITPFGTTGSWADGTIIRNNTTLELASKATAAIGGVNFDNQVRIREWIQFGEQASDKVTLSMTTYRQGSLDGILNIVGELTVNSQNANYGDGGTANNRDLYFNVNEGGIMGAGNIIKIGDGNLRFASSLHEWSGDLDVRDGFVGLSMISGMLFNPNGKVYLGDATGTQSSTVQIRVESRSYGNNNIGIDAPSVDQTFNRDIVVQDNIKQQVIIAAGYLPTSGTIHFTNQINVGAGSSNYVRFYYEDGTNTATSAYRTQLDADLVGHVQETVFDISGNIIGSNRVVMDANNYGVYPAGPPIGDGALFIVLLRGDNSGYSGKISIGNDASDTLNPGRNTILRIGSDTALGTYGAVEFRNGATLQIGGISRTFTENFLFTGSTLQATTAGIENASGTAATITFDSGTQTGTNYQDVGVGLRDGVAPQIFGGGTSALTVVKTGVGDTVFGASTGGGDVADSFSNYTGHTLVEQGTLFAGSNNAFSPNSRFIVSSGATLSPYWSEAGTGFDVTVGSLVGVAGAALNIDSSIFNIGGDNTTDADFAGVISGYGYLNKVGGGAQTISGENDFFGTVSVIQGALIGGSNTAFGSAYNTISLGGGTGLNNLLDAKAELLFAGSATDVVNAVTMYAYGGNDEGITVIGTREISGTYGFAAGGKVSLYQDQREDALYNLIPNSGTNVFFEADGDSTFKFGDNVFNGGSTAVTNVVKIGAGTVELRASNSYGIYGTAGSAIDGGTVIRHGTISVFDNNALSSTVVEMGDTRYALASAYLATTGSLITKAGGSYDVSSNGAGGSGKGAFLNVNALVDGVAITTADIGKRILVKDESSHPEYNGVYQVVSVDATCGQMNLVRVSDFDDASEMLYGSSIAITNGTTQKDLQYFQASSDVLSVNTASTDPVHWLQDIPNASVALVAANGGMNIYNDIDINDTNGSGSTTIGGTFTSGTSYFYGNVTLQHSTLPGVDNVRELTLVSSSNDDDVVTGERGVVFSGVISETQAGDTLSVNKQGAGTVTFTNDNTYTGKTTVTDGTLALSGAGAVSSTSWIEVNSGATFDYSDATAVNLTFNGPISGSGTVVTGAGKLIVGTNGGAGVLRPGMSSDPASSSTAGDGIGLLTVNGNVVLTGSTTGVDRLTLQMGATNGADYNDAANFTTHLGLGAGNFATYLNSQASFYDTKTGGNHDRLVVTGSLTLNSKGHITFTNGSTDYQPVMGDVFNLIDWSSITANGFNVGGTYRNGGLLGDLELPDLSLSGLTYNTSLFASYGIVVVVPEPGRMLLLLFGLTALFCGHRRRA